MNLRIVVALCLLAWGTTRAQSDDWLVTQTRAGKIRLGMRVDDLYNAYGKENVRLVDLYAEGIFTPAMQVFETPASDDPIAEAQIQQICGQFRVITIHVLGPPFRTREGLGVGSTVSEVRKRFPDAKVNREVMPSLLSDKAQMSFVTSDDKFTDSTRIIRMWAWNATLPDSITRCRRR